MVLQMVIGVGFQFIQEAAAKDIDISSALVTVGIAVVLLALVKAIPDTVAGQYRSCRRCRGLCRLPQCLPCRTGSQG